MYLSKAPSSFALLLTNPRVVLSTAGFGKCPLHRHFSREGLANLNPRAELPYYAANDRKRWSPEEESKLLEFRRQGLKMADILRQMPDRSYMSVYHKIKVLRSGATGNLGPWTAQEDAKFLEMQQKGMTHEEITKYLPGRTYGAVKNRALRVGLVSLAKGRTKFTADEIQLIISLRLKSYKGHAEIAEELGRSLSSIQKIWSVVCSKLLTEEDLDSIRLRDAWSENELKRLRELHSRGVARRALALQFPSKSYDSVSSMMGRLGLITGERYLIKAKPEPQVGGGIASHEQDRSKVRS